MIAKQFLWLGLIYLLIGGALALVMRWQLGWPGTRVPLVGAIFLRHTDGIVTPAQYTALFTMHGTIMIFFAITPIVIGALGNFLIPLQIGARDMAFPTLNLLSFWTQLLASVILTASFFAPLGSASAGWTGYPPLSTTVGAPGPGETLWVLALFTAGCSSIMGAVNYVTTVYRHRAPGMTWFRLPLTVWGLFLTAVLNALFVPVLGSAAILLFFDRVLGTHFFVAGAQVAGGGNPMLYQHLFWIFGHPEVYILILPVWGVTSDLLAFFARKPAWAYRVTVLALIAIVVISGLIYGHHMFVTSMSPLLGQGFMVLTMIISVPACILFINWLGTLWRGALRFTSPMLFALGVVFVFGLGGLTGLYLADIPIDMYLHDTFFVVGHFHLTMAAAVFLGAFAAIYFWYPKMFGRMLSERLGKLHFWLSFVPLNGVFIGMLWLGHAGMQRRLYDPSEYATFRHLAQLQRAVSWAAFVLGCGQLVFAWNFISSLWRGARAAANPWQVGTLEWTCAASPPAEHNFDELPTVRCGPHELSRPDVTDRDWLGQAEPLPPSAPTGEEKRR